MGGRWCRGRWSNPIRFSTYIGGMERWGYTYGLIGLFGPGPSLCCFDCTGECGPELLGDILNPGFNHGIIN